MQVSQSEDTITHAVIGGGATIDFKVAESSFLMHMLSTSLYQRPQEAVVRETMCNAWDSHIAANKTDTPIEVTLTTNKLIIKDFGLGIPKNMIGQIYGTYGASTKQDDHNQTGGFGLGSKSPFAVSDHFQVISCNAGEKSIYAMSKSSAEVNGKPGIVPIATVPTQETGVTVTIDIPESQFNAYRILIERIAQNGDIPCIFNGNLQPTISFKNQSNNWIITCNKILDYDNTRLYVRYGNVVYPIENHIKYASEYRDIDRWIKHKLEGRNNIHYNLILQAQPDTISVMPSREGLSMQDHTVNTLTKLIKNFLPVMELYSMPRAIQVLEDSMKVVVAEKNYEYLIDNKHIMPNDHAYATAVKNIEIIRDIDSLTDRIISVSYPSDPAFYQHHKKLRRAGAIEVKPEYAKLLTSLFAAQDLPEFVPSKAQQNLIIKRRLNYRGRRSPIARRAQAWYFANIMRPMLQSIRKQPGMDTKNFYVYERHRGNKGLVVPNQWNVSSLEANFQHFRKIVVLIFGKANLDDRIGRFPIWGGDYPYGVDRDGIFVYHAHDNRKNIDSIRQFFIDSGYIILDLTVPQPWDAPKLPKIGRELYGPPAPPKKRPQVHVALKHVCNRYGSWRVDHAFDPNIKDPMRIDNPVCYVRIEPSRAQDRIFMLDSFNTPTSIGITKWLGERCVVVRNDTDENKLSDAGIPDLKTYIMREVIKTVSTEPRFLAYWQDDMNRSMGNTDGSLLERHKDQLTYISHLFDCDESRTAFGLTCHLNREDKFMLYVWRNMLRDSYRYENIADFTEAMKVVKNLPTNPQIKLIVEELQTNRFVGLLLHPELEKMLVEEPERVVNIIEAAIT